MTFREVENEFHRLRSQLDAGQLTETDLRARLEEMMTQDNEGRWWIIGYETGLWYVHDGEQWVQGVPPTEGAETTTPPAIAEPITPAPPIVPVTPVTQTPPASSVPAKPPAAEPSPPASTPPVQAVQPSAESKRRFPVLGAVLGVALVAVLSIAVALVLRGGGNSGTISQVTPDHTVTATVTEPAVVVDTPTTEPTAVPTDTPEPPTAEPTDTPEPPTSIPTGTPTDTPEPPTETPTATVTPSPVVTLRPILTLRRPTIAVTLRAPVITQRLAPGVITDFEAFGTWARGNEPYGTFTQSKEQVHGGQVAAKLAYDFKAVQNNYVVFQARPAIAISGQPAALTLWVHGDNSGHFINAWVSDSQGEVRQFTFGQIRHTGWQAMTAKLDVTAPWPQGQISRAGNGKLEYPVSLYALVLDGVPDGTAATGTIYLDDLSVTP